LTTKALAQAGVFLYLF